MNEEELQDRELPDESDMDSRDEEDVTDTLPCPRCRKPVYCESEFCHHCGNAISWQNNSKKFLWLFILLAVLLIAALIYSSL
jgi:hypothetical protein